MSGPYATIHCREGQFVVLLRDLAEHGVKFEADYTGNGFWTILVHIADRG